jgi:hypothetical protein
MSLFNRQPAAIADPEPDIKLKPDQAIFAVAHLPQGTKHRCPFLRLRLAPTQRAVTLSGDYGSVTLHSTRPNSISFAKSSGLTGIS